MIVSTSPIIDIEHPIHVTTERAKESYLVCETSISNAKFVKWSHLHVKKPL